MFFLCEIDITLSTPIKNKCEGLRRDPIYVPQMLCQRRCLRVRCFLDICAAC